MPSLIHLVLPTACYTGCMASGSVFNSDLGDLCPICCSGRCSSGATCRCKWWYVWAWMRSKWAAIDASSPSSHRLCPPSPFSAPSFGSPKASSASAAGDSHFGCCEAHGLGVAASCLETRFTVDTVITPSCCPASCLLRLQAPELLSVFSATDAYNTEGGNTHWCSERRARLAVGCCTCSACHAWSLEARVARPAGWCHRDSVRRLQTGRNPGLALG